MVGGATNAKVPRVYKSRNAVLLVRTAVQVLVSPIKGFQVTGLGKDFCLGSWRIVRIVSTVLRGPTITVSAVG